MVVTKENGVFSYIRLVNQMIGGQMQQYSKFENHSSTTYIVTGGYSIV